MAEYPINIRITGKDESAASFENLRTNLEKLAGSASKSGASIRQLDQGTQKIEAVTKKAQGGFQQLDGSLRRTQIAARRSGQDFNKLREDIAGVGTKARETGGLMGSLGNLLKSPFVQAGAAMAGVTLGLGTIKNAIVGVISAAREHEDALLRLKTAIELAGGSWAVQSGKVAEFTDAMQKQSRFSNTAMANSMQMIVQLTGSVAQGYEGAKLAADIASTGLFDLTTSSRYVAMAMSGEVTMLGRYIPALKDSALEQAGVKTAAEKAAYAMTILNEKFGGAAKASLDSYGGSTDQLKNAFGDLQREIGEILIPVLAAFARALTPIVAGFANIMDIIDSVIHLSIEPLQLAFENLDTAAEKSAISISAWGVFPEPFERITEPALESSEALNQLNLSFAEGVPQLGFYAAAADATATAVSNLGQSAELSIKSLSELSAITPITIPVPTDIPEIDIYSEEDLEEDKARIGEWAAAYHAMEIERAQFEEEMAQIRGSREDAAAQKTQQSWHKAYGRMAKLMQPVTAAIQTGMSSIMDTTMTGTQRLQAMWRSFTSAVLQMLSELIVKLIITLALQAATGVHFGKGGEVPGGGIGHQWGGRISGPSGVDRVPAMLTAGEYVMPVAATAMYLPLLESMRLGILSGAVTQNIGHYQMGGVVNENPATYNISVTGHTIEVEELVDLLIPALERNARQRRLEV